ncbi:hypothetical protein Q3G72_028278 [Acer saccharum]|nr:hypothetical protein Q3G72_028278 [Acer saccharum]
MLSNNNLYGEIPSALRNCTDIYILDLGDNKLSGEIPAWLGERASSLLILRLRSNMFYGKIPSDICKLSSLHILDLAINNLSGSIPSCLGNLSGMASDVEYRYEGQLYVATKGADKAKNQWFQAVNMLPSLEELHLPACGLSTIPSSVPLVNLTSLSVLELSNNGFNSSMPSWLFNLTGLVYVDLSSNNFQGELPDQFADLKFIQHIDLSENSFIEGKLSTSLTALGSSPEKVWLTSGDQQEDGNGNM